MAQVPRCLRLSSGLSWLDEWSATAGQIEQNAVYEALFAVADGSAFWAYRTFDEDAGTHEFFVVVRDNLVVKIAFTAHDAFGITYIGPLADAPGLNRIT